MLAAVSFLGYAAVKYFGASHGLLLASAAGGLVSSTAVTAANARRAAAGEGSPDLLAAGVAVATAISFLRVVVLAAVIKPSLLTLLAPALIAAALVAAGFALHHRFIGAEPGTGKETEVEFRNPFDFSR